MKQQLKLSFKIIELEIIVKKILVHTHIYYENLYPELKACLLNLKDYDCDYIFTLVKDNESLESDIKSNFSNAKIEIVKNLGFDLGPFVHVLNEVNLDDYSYVIKLHTKRDIPVNGKRDWYTGSGWRESLLKFIKSKSSFDEVLQRLEANPTVGMHGPNICTFNKKTDDHFSYKQASKYFTDKNLKKTNYKFVAGTMFMVRAELLEFIKKLKITQYDFESPDLSHEGCQMAHIFERLCGYTVISQGYQIVDCTYNIAYSKFLYFLLNLKKFIMSSIITVRITRKNKLLVKVLRIPVFAMKLKNGTSRKDI